MIVLLLKVTLLLVFALCLQLPLRRASAAVRHLVCAVSLFLCALMPLTLLLPRGPVVLRLPLTTFTAFAARAGSVRWSAMSLVMPVWILGVVLVLLWVAAGYWQVSRLRRRAIALDEGRVGVFEAEVDVPVAVGLVRPAILLPASASTWPAAHRAAALRHEAAHIARNDLWTNLLAHLVCAVYWFHPLAWAVARRMREEQELACDDATLNGGTPADLYAEALLAAARFARSSAVISPIGCPMITRTSLKNRIARLVDAGLSRTPSRLSLWRAAALIAVAGVGVGLVNAGPQVPDADKVYKVGNGVSAPRVLLKIDPDYTDEASAAKISGTVLLTVVIGTDGVAHRINVLKGLDGGLDVKAVEAVQRWKFAPGELNGQAVEVRAQIEINFRMK